MDTSATNQMKALEARIQKVYGSTGALMNVGSGKDKSADKLFVTFLLVGLAEEHGLLDDNCNRAVTKALNAIGMEERSTPLYLEDS